MIYFKLYDRNDLSFVDSGIVKDYNIDFDYITNNTSTLSMVKASAGYQGNIIALSEDITLIALGVVTAIDNTDLKISFKHPKELLNDNVLNVFKYTNLLGKKFDAVQGLKTIIEYAFINTTDELKKLPLTIATIGSAPNGIWTDDGNTIDLLSFIDTMFDRYNIYLDFDIDFNNQKLLCKIVKNTTEGYMIKDNIKLSKPEIDNAELPKENKAVFFNKTTGTVVNTYYLLQDNSVTQNSSNPNRLSPTVTKYIEWDEAEAIKEGYTMVDLAKSELGGNVYNHCILYKLAKKQTMVKAINFRYGDKVKIIYNGREYDSVFTGLKFKMNEPFYTCMFGKTRIDFTDRMKMYNNHKFEKRRS